MPLDPGLAGVLAYLDSLKLPPMSSATPSQARRAFRRSTYDFRPPEMVLAVGEVSDVTLPGPAGELGARVYRPASFEAPAPTVLFLHGGGWVIGDLDTHDNQARRICRETGAVVVSLDYRRAPEAPWPLPVLDAEAGLAWVHAHVEELGGDPARVAVAGDSAGGNLAAVLCLRARDAGGPPIAAQLLLYPATDFAGEYASRVENADGYYLTAETMEWFAAHYLSGSAPVDLKSPDLSPLHGELAGLPPAVVVTAEFDPIRDEGDAYASALVAEGVAVTHVRAAGMIHGFFDLGPASPAVEATILDVCAKFRSLL